MPTERPRHPLLGLREEMDRLFDDFFGGSSLMPFRRRVDTDPWRRFQGMFEATFPTADVVEDGKSYRISAELPGMSEKDIEISLAGDVLTIKGEKKEEHEEKGKSRYVSERRYGSFQRSFALPEDADAEAIEASCRNGVLTVTLPKRPEAQAKMRRIEVKAT
ncbi:MAG: Hsp20/alpha crystallin family protein [Geminicoccaceae bacterium]